MIRQELETRALASSDDLIGWHAIRAGGITATEVRDLRLGVIKAGDLMARKAEPPKDLSHVRHIAHGNDREPIIAEWVAQRFGIHPNKFVFCSEDNSQFLATPDGVGFNFDDELLISEIKTSKYDLNPDAPHYAQTGYEYQIQFQLMVTGAKRCLFVWEQHNDDWSGWPLTGPAPLGRPRFVWIERNEKLISELRDIAEQFLYQYERKNDYTGDAQLANLADRYLRTVKAEASFAKAKREVWDAIHAHLHNSAADTYKPGNGIRVTWTPGRSETVTVADPDAAMAADPALYEMWRESEAAWLEHLAKFQREEIVVKRPQLRITEPKEEK